MWKWSPKRLINEFFSVLWNRCTEWIWMTVGQVPVFVRFSECQMSLWWWETNGVHLSVSLKGWFITLLHALELNCFVMLHDSIFWSSGGQMTLHRSSLYQPFLQIVLLLMWCFICSLCPPPAPDACWMQAPLSIVCFCPLQSFPRRNKLIKSFLL